jgi:hypothetical protein
LANDTNSTELAKIVENAMHEFSEAMYHREQLSIRIGRRTTQIIRFGMFGLSVLGLIMFYLLYILTTDFARITSNMEIMSGRMTNLDDTFVTVSKDMGNLRQTLSQKLEDFPVDRVMKNILATSKVITRLANSPELHQSIRSLNETLENLNRLVKSPELQKSIASLDDLGSLARNIDTHVEPLNSDIHVTLAEVRNTMMQTRGTLESTQNLVGDEELLYAIDNALAEITSAARSVRDLTDFLEREPQSILRGKDTPGGN